MWTRPAARCIAASATRKRALTEPGLIVYRFDAPLVFANAAFFVERLEALLARRGPGLEVRRARCRSHQRFRLDRG